MSDAHPRVRPVADLLLFFGAPGVWFAHLSIVYGAEALICTPPVAAPGAMIWVGAAATAAALAALGAFAFITMSQPVDRTEHPGVAFMRGTALLLTLLSGLGVIWTAFPLAILPVCAAPAG
jgi:hypothetical protein